jgi:hypothetical protein
LRCCENPLNGLGLRVDVPLGYSDRGMSGYPGQCEQYH